MPRIDTVTTDLRAIEMIIPPDGPLLESLRAAIPTFGGKATHASALSHIPGLPLQKSFAIPIAHYVRFMHQNGFVARVAALLADPAFSASLAERDRALAALRKDMMQARVDIAFCDALVRKLRTEFPGARMRFRSSTNGEDLEGFTGAGLYESMSGSLDEPSFPLLVAVRGVWASVWNLRSIPPFTSTHSRATIRSRGRAPTKRPTSSFSTTNKVDSPRCIWPTHPTSMQTKRFCHANKRSSWAAP